MIANQISSNFGFKVISEEKIDFFHVLLPKVSIKELSQFLPEVKKIEKKTDGTLTLSLNEDTSSEKVMEKLKEYFERKSLNFLETPKNLYSLSYHLRRSLQTWSLAFEGALGLLLENDKNIKDLTMNSSWEYINSNTGGLYLSPYTLFLYKDYPRIVHPVTLQNYEARKMIEQTASSIIRKMLKRVTQAQKGMEGIALISMVEAKTGLSSKEIVEIINRKSFGVKAPILSPFFCNQI